MAPNEAEERMKEKKFARVRRMGRTYVKQRRLGKGSFGEAWLCVDRVRNINVVVKVSHAAMATERDEIAAKKEVAIMETLDHPNIVRMYEAWVESAAVAADERLHIAMEYCDAGDIGSLLRDRLKENEQLLDKMARHVRQMADPYIKGLSPDTMLEDKDMFAKVHHKVTCIADKAYADVVKKYGRLYTWALPELESWLVQLLWGIWYMHKKKIVHRDIKPDNVFLAGGGKIIKIGDFGISGLQAHTNALLRTRAGTPLFMAPEMWTASAQQGYTDRCDVYALGAMFFELSSLLRPYDGRFPLSGRWGSGTWSAQHMRFLKEQITSSQVRPLSIPPAQLEASFYEVVKTMLRKDPRVRPTAGQVLRSLRMQAVVRRVIDIFAGAGEGCDMGDPLMAKSDLRHSNVVNPANNQFTLHAAARFPCSWPDAEVLMMTERCRATVRKGPSMTEVPLGYVTYGDLVEVHSREESAKDDVTWILTHAGWCTEVHKGRRIFAPAPEALLSRDPNDAADLGEYETVVADVQTLLKDALRVKLERQRPQSAASAGSGTASSPIRAPASSRASSAARRASASPRGAAAAAAAAVAAQKEPQEPQEPQQQQQKQQQQPASAARRKASPAAAARGRSPTPPRRMSSSPVVRRLTTPSPPRKPSDSPTRKQPKAHPPNIATAKVVRRTPARGGGASPARNPSPSRATAPRDQAMKLKDKVVASVGREQAKRLFLEYFKAYERCLQKNMMQPGGMCAELREYEAELKAKLGEKAFVVRYVRECAQQQ